jgi:hypothetical protein
MAWRVPGSMYSHEGLNSGQGLFRGIGGFYTDIDHGGVLLTAGGVVSIFGQSRLKRRQLSHIIPISF